MFLLGANPTKLYVSSHSKNCKTITINQKPQEKRNCITVNSMENPFLYCGPSDSRNGGLSSFAFAMRLSFVKTKLSWGRHVYGVMVVFATCTKDQGLHVELLSYLQHTLNE